MVHRSAQRQTYDGIKTVVPSAAAETPLLGTNPNRLFASIFNDSTAVLSIVLGTTGELAASGADVAVAAGGYYEVPEGYVGPVYGQWAAANGNARIKELV